MVLIGLQISANLENIELLKTNYPDYAFFIKIKCSHCGEISNNWHDLIESERIQLDTRNKEGHHFLMKCKMCGRQNSIDIVEKSNCSYVEDDSEKFKTIVIFDCRGVEPIEFSPRSGWIVQAAMSGKTFENVDLSEDDWVEYDEKSGNVVGISEFTSKFIKLKK